MTGWAYHENTYHINCVHCTVIQGKNVKKNVLIALVALRWLRCVVALEHLWQVGHITKTLIISIVFIFPRERFQKRKKNGVLVSGKYSLFQFYITFWVNNEYFIFFY